MEQYNGEYTDTINTLKKDTYVNDIQGGADSIKSLRRFKVEATQIMAKAGFTLHKWHSSVRALKLDEVDEQLEEMSVKANCNTKILRIRFHTLRQKTYPHQEKNYIDHQLTVPCALLGSNYIDNWKAHF